jgi:hypothetical protein
VPGGCVYSFSFSCGCVFAIWYWYCHLGPVALVECLF